MDFFFYFSYLLLFFFFFDMTHQINVCFKGSLFALSWFRISDLEFRGVIWFFAFVFLYICSYCSHNRFPLCSNVLPLEYKYPKRFKNKIVKLLIGGLLTSLVEHWYILFNYLESYKCSRNLIRLPHSLKTYLTVKRFYSHKKVSNLHCALKHT